MDTRTELQKNDRLHFPDMECTIEHSLGRGSNVIAYVGHYKDNRYPTITHRVLIRELFPYDPKGLISRNPDGSIHIESEAIPLYCLNRKTFEKGIEVHNCFLRENPADIDLNINNYEYNNTLYSLVGYSGGRNLYEEFGRAHWKDRTVPGNDQLLHIIHIIKGALKVLQSFHQAGYLHLDISPDNILLVGEGESERVTLIDYNSVHTIDEVSGKHPLYYSMKEGFTAPEVRRGRNVQIREWTDLYSMTAVLYLCLTGKKLTPSQMVGINPINIGLVESSFLKDSPETVLAMVRQILRKGLAIRTHRRYQKVSQMLVDLTELEDRIEGRGITHWALWEAGRERIRRSLRENPAMSYLLDDKKIYPLYAESEDGEKISLLQDLQDIFFPRSSQILSGQQDSHPKKPVDDASSLQAECCSPLLLLGGGGTGKTTALLRVACSQENRYRASSAIMYYISLYDYRDSNPNYICDTLLKSLKFKKNTDSWESARQELLQLLDKTSEKNLLLLDGLNEASGNIEPLIEEINRLSSLACVRIILTSRSDPNVPSFKKLSVCRLQHEEVYRILSKEGILPPENREVFDLLTFPMLLSMYIKTVRDKEQQLCLDNREQLIEEYFAAILKKEKKNLPEESTLSMCFDAAVRYLLPEIAAMAAEKKHALSASELQPLVENCYKELSGKTITAVFPEWIGHTSDLRFGAKTADDWYGITIREILWKRLGLLVRDEQGNYRILHQIIEDYLLNRSIQFHTVFDMEKRREKTWRGILYMSAALILLSSIAVYTIFMYMQLSEKQRQLIQQETVNLTRLSETALELGNCYEAVDASLQALLLENKESSVTTKAEHALASSLKVFQPSSFYVSCSVDLPEAVCNKAVSKTGEFLVVYDRMDILRCFDGRTGEELWKLTEIYAKSLQIIEEEKYVLVIGGNGIAAYSLEEGLCIWKNDQVGAGNYLIHDRELILFQHDNDYDVNGKASLFFSRIDLHTGKKTVPDVKYVDPAEGYSASMDTCKFVRYPDSKIYYLNLRLIDGEPYGYKELLMDQVDISDGRHTRTINVPVDKIDNLLDWQGTVPYSVQYIPQEMSYTGKGGLFFCFFHTPYIKTETNLIMGFIEDGSSEWSYFEQYDMEIHDLPDHGSYPANAVPVLHVLPDKRIMILFGSEMIVMNCNGESADHRSLPTNIEDRQGSEPSFKSSSILMCKYQENPFSLFVLYEDGRAEYLLQDFSHLKTVQLLNMGLRTACGAGKNNQCSDTHMLYDSGYEEEFQDAFCAVPSDNLHRIYIVTWTGDFDGKTLTEAEMSNYLNGYSRKDLTGEILYIMPDGVSLLVLYPQSPEKLDEEVRQMKGAVIDLSDMNVIKRISFAIPKEDVFLKGISADGNILFFRNHTYNMKSETLSEVEEAAGQSASSQILPQSGQFIRERIRLSYDEDHKGPGLDSGREWDGETLHWIFHGKEHTISLLDHGSNILEHRARDFLLDYKWDDPEYFSRFDFLSGDNGLLFVRCTDRETEPYARMGVDYLMVYSLKKGNWEKVILPEGTAADVLPYPAESKQIFAIGGADNAVRIYDMDSGKFITKLQKDIDPLDLKKMCFIMDDKYIAVWDIFEFSVFETSTGERVFYKDTGSNFLAADTLSGFVFEDEDSLFVTGKAGFCLDTRTWEIRYNIPYLATVTQDAVITQEHDSITLYPKYTVSDLIRKGEEILEGLPKAKE